MATYDSIKDDITNSLMGRPSGTEIQPENHQNFALELLEYTRSVELISASPLQGFADVDTVPLTPDTSFVSYLGGVGTGETKTYANFIGIDGQPITASSENGQSFILVFFWNKQYWELHKFQAFVYSDAPALEQTPGESMDNAISQKGMTKELERAVYIAAPNARLQVYKSSAAWYLKTPSELGVYSLSRYIPFTGNQTLTLTLSSTSKKYRVYFNTNTNAYQIIEQTDALDDTVYANEGLIFVGAYETSLNNISAFNSPFPVLFNGVSGNGEGFNNAANESITAIIVQGTYPNIDTVNKSMTVKANSIILIDLLRNRTIIGPATDQTLSLNSAYHNLKYSIAEGSTVTVSLLPESSDDWKSRDSLWAGYIDVENSVYCLRFPYTINGQSSGLPIASNAILGGIKLGNYLKSTADGTVSVDEAVVKVSADPDNATEKRDDGLYTPTVHLDTAEQILQKLLTVDGSGSGLTSDYLVNQRDGSVFKVWIGTRDMFNAISTKSDDTFYIVRPNPTTNAAAFAKTSTNIKNLR